MASPTESDVASQAASAMRAAQRLNAVHQEIREAIDGIIASQNVVTQRQAVKDLQCLQERFNHLAAQVKCHAGLAKQCSRAASRCLPYDKTASHKAAYCLALERSASLLDSYQRSKPYGRSHL